MCKNNNPSSESNGNPVKKYMMSPHVVWTIVILSTIIIMLLGFIMTKRMTNANTIKVFIDYAATLLSITLSIFAIAFTYTSNNSTQRQFDKIDYASMKIVDSATNLNKSEQEISSSIKIIHERILSIENDMGFIKNNIPNVIIESKPTLAPNVSNQIE